MSLPTDRRLILQQKTDFWIFMIQEYDRLM